MTIILVSILASLIFSAFFSGIEIAFVSSNNLKIELDKKLGLLPAKIYSFLLRHKSKFISALLVGNNIALVVYGIFMADLLEAPISSMFGFINNNALADAAVLLCQTVVSTLIILLFAEFLPKIIFRVNPNRKLELFTLPVLLICMPLFGFIWLLFKIMSYVMRIFSVRFEENSYSFGRIDLDHYVKEAASTSKEESTMENELQIFQNALDFNTVKARECMIPRNEIEAVNMEDSVEILRAAFVQSGYSKLLVYKENIDNVIGYVHSYDLFQRPVAIRNILRPIAIVPETTTADKVLKALIEQKKNVALVVDEYGGTSGMLTLEDIVEEIFGEIQDEHDSEDLKEEELGNGIYLFSARLEVDYINDAYNLQLPVSEDYETLAGLIINENEDIPEEGESLLVGEYTLRIIRVSEHKIEEVQVSKTESD